MAEAFVQLLCPECNKSWTSPSRKLPSSDEQFSCPDCPTTRNTVEFLRTEHDLETLQQFT